MDRAKAAQDIMELFIRAVQKYNGLEKIPQRAGTKHDLFHSERHLLDKIGDFPQLNVSEFARSSGKTKGAISQLLKKLESKGLARRYKSGDNDKEVFVELTKAGRDVYVLHRKKNDETLTPLLEELKKHRDDQVRFFVSMMKWIVSYLEQSEKQMKGH